jgi:hypothetical protein
MEVGMNAVRAVWVSLGARLTDERYRLDPPDLQMLRDYYIGFSHACVLLGAIADDEWRTVQYGQ